MNEAILADKREEKNFASLNGMSIFHLTIESILHLMVFLFDQF
jgi:hypothetical protein